VGVAGEVTAPESYDEKFETGFVIAEATLECFVIFNAVGDYI
jgi:hypothetical protein